ncbi:MAG TPA: carboxypeptidase-like regulatory domain-containing protein, partial [Planctomycetota bacterium]|nr:carboxypeptidase-like regulatory domain-containing protein [Planctomycetota bacterium]
AGVRFILWPNPINGEFSIAYASSASATFGESPITDESGRATLDVPANQAFRLSVESEEFVESKEVDISALNEGEQRTIEFSLATSADARFVARIVDDETGAPLTGAWAMRGDADVIASGEPMWGAASGSGGSEAVSIADDMGLIEVAVGSWEDLVVRVGADGRAWIGVPADLTYNSRDKAREVRLKRSAAVDVVVSNPSGVALVGAIVELAADADRLVDGPQFDGYFAPDPVRWTLTTDAQGRALIQGLPSSVQLELSIRAHEDSVTRPPQSIVLDVGEVRRMEWTMEAGVTLSGWLRTPAGEGVAHAEIWLKPQGVMQSPCFHSYDDDDVQRTVSSEAGEFLFREVGPGTWSVGCSPDEPFAPNGELVTVSEGRVDRALNLIAISDGFIRGRVVGPTGEPRRASVYASPKDTGCPASDETDSDGTFALGPLRAGLYDLGAMPLGGERQESLSMARSVEAESGSAGVVLTLGLGGKLSGRVVLGGSGQGVESEVQLQATEDSDASWWSFTSTSKEGEFDFEGVEAGTYTLIGSSPSGYLGWRSHVSIAAGTHVSEVVLELSPATPLRVKYVGKGEMGQIRARCSGGLVLFESVEQGSETTFLVPPGRIELQFEEWPESSAGPRDRIVDVVVGELTTVEFGPTNQ